jgi:hypothetical protein
VERRHALGGVPGEQGSGTEQRMALLHGASAAAHELHNFDLGAGLQYSIGPVGLFDDPAVEFHRDARGVQPELFEQSQDRLSLGGRAGFAVQDDLYDHASVDTLVLQPL